MGFWVLGFGSRSAEGNQTASRAFGVPISAGPMSRRVAPRKGHPTEDVKASKRARTIVEPEPAGRPEKLEDDNGYALAGIVSKITLKNFMNHRNRVFEMHPNINFIHGVNGSGKSAVIAALQTCLGSTARETRRGKSLSSLIQRQKDWSEVVVEIKNEGGWAFRPDKYGSCIKIRRYLTRDGQGNRFEMRSETGRIISRKREDLNVMLSHFSIQVSNPCVILTQDDARDLLAGKSEKEKYGFFERATKLKDMREVISSVTRSIADTQMQMSIQENMCNEKQQSVEAAHDEYKKSRHIVSLHERLDELRIKFLWAVVAEKEAKETELEDLVKAIQKKMGKYETQLEKIAGADSADAVQQVQDQLEAELKTMQRDEKQLNDKFNGLRKQQQDSRRQRKETSRAIMGYKKAKSQAQKRSKRLATDMQELLDTSSRDDEARDRKVKIGAAEKELARLRTAFEKRSADLETLRSKPDDSSSDLREAMAEISELQGTIRQLENQRNKLHRSRGNRVARFGKYAEQVQQAIERAQFRVRPVGPLGKYVKVRAEGENQRWLPHIEYALGKVMEVYLVDNYHDRVKMKQILRRYYGENTPDVVATKYSSAKYPIAGKLRGGDLRIADMVDIEDPWVFNACIDECHHEFVYLFRNDRHAYDFVKRTHGAARALLTDLATVSANGNSVSRSRGKDPRKIRSNYLRVDVEADLKRCEEDLGQSKSRLQELQRKASGLKTAQRRRVTAMRKAEELVNRTENAMQDAEEQLEQLAQDPGDEPDEVAGEIEEIRAQIAGEQARAEKLEGDIVRKEAEGKELEQNIKGLEAEKREVRDELRKVAAKINNLKETFDEKINGIQKKRDEKRRVEKRLEKLRIAGEEKSRELREWCDKVRQHRQRAERLKPERPDLEGLSKKEIAIRVERLERELKSEEKEHGDPDAIEQRYNDAKAEYEKSKDDLERSKRVLKQFKRSNKDRKATWKEFRSELCRIVNYGFQDLLSNRGYEGSIVFNHKESTLCFDVKPSNLSSRDTSRSSSRDTSQLSGGEKSFTTVAFVLSLMRRAGVIDSPFRVADEFDIYMDSLNRKISMKLLIEEATAQKGKQWFFLTPQDINGIDKKDNIKIIKLPKPKRGAMDRFVERKGEDS